MALTPEDRTLELQERVKFRRQLANSVDQAVSSAAHKGEVNTSCWGGLLTKLGRWSSKKKHQRLIDLDVSVSSTAIGGQSTSEATTSRSIFSMRRKDSESTPLAVRQLQQVGATLEKRIENTEQKAASNRVEASRHFADGNKLAAMRSLRRSKTLEKQVSSLLATATAIENQSDLLETAGLQKEVAAALSAGAKGMKTSHKTLKSVEQVTDQLGEIQDASADVEAALSQLGDSSYADTGDDEELLRELMDMSSAHDDDLSTASVVPSQPVSIAAYPETPLIVNKISASAMAMAV